MSVGGHDIDGAVSLVYRVCYLSHTLLIVVLSRHDACVGVVAEGRDHQVGDHDGLQVEPGGRGPG